MYTLYGDSNLDGSVNGTDLNAVLSYYNQSSQSLGNHGDFNYDGSVNGTDLNTVLSNYNQSLSGLDRRGARAFDFVVDGYRTARSAGHGGGS